MPSAQTEQPEEDATELKFPKEFESAEPLLISEVYLLLEHRHEQSEEMGGAGDPGDPLAQAESHPVFLKTLAYTKQLAKFKNKDTIRAVRQLLASRPLHRFEVAQLGNLCPDGAEEAKALIPSLENKMEDDELDELLKDMQSKKTFQ